MCQELILVPPPCAAYVSDERSFQYASDSLKSSKSFVTSLVTLKKPSCGWAYALEFASVDIQADPEVVLASVTNKGISLEHAATELKSDRTIALAAINQNPKAFTLVSESLRNDPGIIQATIDSMGLSFDVSSSLSSGSSPMGNRDLMLLLAPLGKDMLKFASVEIKNDHEVVLTAVRADCHSLRYASVGMRNIPEIVLAATAGDPNGIMSSWASAELLSSRDFALAVVSQSDENRSGLHLEHFPAEICRDPHVAIAAVQNGADVSFCGINPNFSNAHLDFHRILVKMAVSRDGDHLLYVQGDKEISMLAVTKGVCLRGHRSCGTRGTRALHYASKELRDDHELVLAAVENTCRALEFASARLCADFEVVLTAVAQNAAGLLWASQDMKTGLFAQIQENLNLHRCLVVLLLGMVSSDHTSFVAHSEKFPSGSSKKSATVNVTGRCLLPTLGNFDPETGTSIKMQIADFIGLPRGTFLKKLRAARANIEQEES